MKKNVFPLIVLLLISAFMGIPPSYVSGEPSEQANYTIGVWNNFDFTLPAQNWSTAAQKFGGEKGIVDLVVAQAQQNGVALPFPFENRGYLYGSSNTDKAMPYLQQFNSDSLEVILSIQPLKANITELIDILLSRYAEYGNILGINVDMEWKESGTPYHVNDGERDAWLNKIKSYNPSYKLFLTYFKDYTYFPQDSEDLVILFDGEADTQLNLLREYQKLAEHYSSVGLYTGYPSCTPQTAPVERILDVVPKTEYIIHTYDVFSNKQIVIFELDDVQVDWLEQISMNLLNLHIEKRVPVCAGVIPVDFDNDSVSGGYLADYISYINQNYFDIVEMGQHGYTHHENETLGGKSYEEQRTIIESGLNILESLGIKPATFTPPYGDADNTTVKVLEALESRILIDLFQNLESEKLMLISGGPNDTHWTYLIENRTLKSAENLMTEIDQQNDGNPFMILYHIQDFRNQTLFNQFSNLLDELKRSEKYNFMTPKQYREYLLNEYISTTTEPQSKPLLIFEMDDLQIDWLALEAVRLIDIHREKSIPVVLGVIPYNFDAPEVGQQSALANYLKDIHKNYNDTFEIGQNGYIHDQTEILENKNYGEQKSIIQRGYNILKSIGIEPSTFISPYGSADNTTLKVLEDLYFEILVTDNHYIDSERVFIADYWISLTESAGNRTRVLKTVEELMAEIDSSKEEAVIIRYRVQDFLTDNRAKRREFETILDTLRENGYTFLTLKQYRDTLGYTNYDPLKSTIIDPYLLLYIIPVTAIITGSAYIFLKRKKVSNKYSVLSRY